MNKTTSIYLDLLRFISALLVVFYHAKFPRFDGSWLKAVGAFGHDAVMVFFVLSGFVIAYVTSIKENDLATYVKKRIARLYSVALPALLITVILDYLGSAIDPEIYTGSHYESDLPILRFFMNLFFLNEIWFESWRAFSNGPFWSLSYEFWYYIVFASWFYFSSYKRWFYLIVSMLIAGPKIMILMPVWVMGVITYYVSTRKSFSFYLSIILCLLPIFLYWYIRDSGVQKIIYIETTKVLGKEFLYEKLNFSRWFISDYIVGLLVSMHIMGFVMLSKNIKFNNFAAQLITYLANMTFALYLLHYPLLQFFGSFINNGIIIFTLTFSTVLLISPYTEGAKNHWLFVINKVILFVRNKKKR
ncbi:acyltransferase family protein [Vibrio breoganii]